MSLNVMSHLCFIFVSSWANSAAVKDPLAISPHNPIHPPLNLFVQIQIKDVLWKQVKDLNRINNNKSQDFQEMFFHLNSAEVAKNVFICSETDKNKDESDSAGKWGGAMFLFMNVADVVSQTSPWFEYFWTETTFKLQPFKVICFNVSFQVCDVFGNFPALKTLPNMLVIAIQYFDHKRFKELVHV